MGRTAGTEAHPNYYPMLIARLAGLTKPGGVKQALIPALWVDRATGNGLISSPRPRN